MSESSWSGRVHSIHVAQRGSGAIESPGEVRAIAGQGLDGDRYCNDTGYYSGDSQWDCSVTLVALEAIEAANRDYGLGLSPGDVRRNIVTSGVPLDDLVGKRFTVGGVVLEGIKPWPPCTHLRDLLGKPRLLEALAHRAGLGAEIVTGGTMKVGDPVTPA